MSEATDRLAHSRERIRRHLVRSQAADPQRQAARSRRHMWLGAALAVALLLAWQQPWRRASGLARGLALVVAGLKVPGMLHTLVQRAEQLMGWWHTVSAARAPPGAEPPAAPSETDRMRSPEGPSGTPVH